MRVPCQAPACDRTTGGRSPLCALHAKRLKRTGKLEAQRRSIHWPSLEAKFNAYTPNRPEGGCWIWTGTRQTGGNYGLVTKSGEHGIVYAHRWSYEHFVGKIPQGFLVRHACDNPPCVNPKHLSVGTPQDNSNDAIERGRVARGPRVAGVILTADQVRGIRHAISNGHASGKVAKAYEVSPMTISSITSGTNWAYVGADGPREDRVIPPTWICGGVTKRGHGCNHRVNGPQERCHAHSLARRSEASSVTVAEPGEHECREGAA